MIFRVFAAALAAGMIAAVLITGLQAIITIPMILEAETYETAGGGHDHGSHDHGESTDEHADASTNGEVEEEEEWGPKDGMERLLYTLLANCVAAIGYALLLVVGLTFDKSSASAERGIVWGIAGFAIFTLAPSLGLAPELPGMPAGDLAKRQIWWIATVLFSGAGLGAAVFGKSAVIKILGLVLLVLPHVWGAPHGVGESDVPAELAARFAASTVVLNAVFWVMIGYFSGLIFARLGKKEGAT